MHKREDLQCLKDMLEDMEEKVYKNYEELKEDIFLHFGLDISLDKLKELELK